MRIRIATSTMCTIVEIRTVVPFLLFICPPDSSKESSNIQPPIYLNSRNCPRFTLRNNGDGLNQGRFLYRIATYISANPNCQPSLHLVSDLLRSFRLWCLCNRL